VDVSLTNAADGTVAAKAHPLDLTLGRATPARADAPAARRLRAAAPVATPLVSLTSH
jgi:hypothetical protein